MTRIYRSAPILLRKIPFHDGHGIAYSVEPVDPGDRNIFRHCNPHPKSIIDLDTFITQVGPMLGYHGVEYVFEEEK